MPGAKPYTLSQTMQHPLARMLPLLRLQMQVYRLGEKHPPSGPLDGHGPDWEAMSMVLAARSTAQARINLQRDFTWLAVSATSSVIDHGGFRAQFYDTKKALRFADRGVQMAQIAGPGGAVAPNSGYWFLREPYRFDEPDSQLYVLVQNLETVANTIQLVFYGSVLRFNAVVDVAAEFPGGPISSAVGGG